MDQDSTAARNATVALEAAGGTPEQGDGGARPASEIEQRIADLRVLLDQGLADGIGVGHSLGIHLKVLEIGRSVWTLQPSPAAANAMFVLHGGVLSTLADTAMGSAVYTALPARTLYTTLELKVNFIRQVALDGPILTCEGRAVHVGRRTATAEATVTTVGGKLVAHGSCTCLLTSA